MMMKCWGSPVRPAPERSGRRHQSASRVEPIPSLQSETASPYCNVRASSSWRRFGVTFQCEREKGGCRLTGLRSPAAGLSSCCSRSRQGRGEEEFALLSNVSDALTGLLATGALAQCDWGQVPRRKDGPDWRLRYRIASLLALPANAKLGGLATATCTPS